MSATLAPFGLRPAFHPSGLDRAQALADGIVSGYAFNIFKGQPVQYDTNGNIILATVGAAWSGAFAGVQWTDVSGRGRVSNFWPQNTGYVAGSCVAYFYNDQNIVYEIQAGGPMTQDMIGDEFAFGTINAGSTFTGLSACTLDATTAVGPGGQGQMRVVDLAPYPGNEWGDNFTIVRVVNSQSQFFGSVTAI